MAELRCPSCRNPDTDEMVLVRRAVVSECISSVERGTARDVIVVNCNTTSLTYHGSPEEIHCFACDTTSPIPAELKTFHPQHCNICE